MQWQPPEPPINNNPHHPNISDLSSQTMAHNSRKWPTSPDTADMLDEQDNRDIAPMLEKKRRPPLSSWSYCPLLDDQKRRAATYRCCTHTPISLGSANKDNTASPASPPLFSLRPNNTERKTMPRTVGYSCMYKKEISREVCRQKNPRKQNATPTAASASTDIIRSPLRAAKVWENVSKPSHTQEPTK
jgi:hypothetical protein